MSNDKELFKGYHEVWPIENLKVFIEEATEKWADNNAFLVKDVKGGEYKGITYAEFLNDVNALGTKLIDLGLKDQKIAVMGENCYDWVVAYFATINGTGVVVPMDKDLSAEEIRNLLNTAECEAIFYTTNCVDKLEGLEIKYRFEMEMYESKRDRSSAACIRNVIDEGKKLLEAGDRRFLDAEIDNQAMASLIFTSGTTGNPKGVMLSHFNLCANIMDTARMFLLNEQDVNLTILPMNHTFGSTIGFMAFLYRGGSVAIFEGLKYITKNLAESKTTFLIGVPLIFESVHAKIWKTAKKEGKENLLKNAIKVNRKLKHIGIDLSSKLFKSVHDSLGGHIRVMLCGGAALDPAIGRDFLDFGFLYRQGYGLTECCPLVSGLPDFKEGGYKKAGSCGPALPEGEFKIENPDENGIGDIYYRGPNVMIGYYNMPEETAEVLDEEGWYKTGDLGFLDPEGCIYLTGRKKNVIVTKTGKNIYPEEIEGYVQKIPYVAECMAYGTDSEDGTDTIVSVQVKPDMDAVVELLGENPSDEAVYKLIRGEIAEMNMALPNWKRMRYITIKKADFVKTSTKKIKRSENMNLLPEEQMLDV